ncbi:hypothetical protein EMIHUDRAFT_121950 [Emiliania huxleyi CCMP1516]|uniref:AB hydrolase-1 domain-containing protein n=2 Tax=Emiliania huxleyi TaxID=2903 RepID=A0A0D3KI57_EMIH1|nr:hypothetical protein EMIHUDRAFT_120936 [Emiliania huxleyi CCMP1516]XP_005787871.1 hypothetical protein EMIHUDRAFT_98467 [Emiliania huxleyi CCMP1516]XP_005792685.1 hypothetical protein EMIHUDRAFT_121950 [Emiliania huxleyi CCMP1516]EOD08274.1 hypothetical protein EMIHUDRAFT_120936 [Emiliania huxleyi CCMP1516]EOD35442.1 hypothetical protein EMIHUDRAFT_98467 [Emiliania huxleyi CCMP1516]EOD40256.1 hypothetical protein EMIHUDRAFT_121950 [Emiliania huxleyi CCMP1516]|eukprot:XP_005760703.1 hypothetical protein EMIHUDRAFT_120936 [Emiliania huxleyi CCMP1516]
MLAWPFLLAALTLLLAAVLTRYYEVVSLLSAPADHLSDPLPPGIGVDGIEAYLSERDERAGPLQPGVSSCVRWAGRRGAATDVAVVFLHGWSASPEEIDPADAEIATQLGANLVRVRLSGHGLAPPERAGRGLCEQAKCGELLRDAAVSLALGRLAGRRVVLVGCSTGGTLAVWLACQAWARPALAALVLVSPGFALSLAGRAYALFKWPALLLPLPAATRLVHCVAGRTHHVPFVSEEQARVCTMAYPSESVVNLCAVYTSVQLADVAAIGRARLPTLVFANPADPVVSYAAMRCQLAAAAAEFVDVLDSEEPHVITGRIYSPSTVARVVDRASAFLGRALGEGAQ